VNNVAGKIRTLKPAMLEDELVAGMSDTAVRLFMAGLLLADDHGNLRASAPYLLGQVFWSRAPQQPLEEALSELTSRGLWETYLVGGQTYAHIRGWRKHQRIDNASEPRVPLPPGWRVTSKTIGNGRKVYFSEPVEASCSDLGGQRSDLGGHWRLDQDQEEEEDQEGDLAPLAPAPTLDANGLVILAELVEATDLWPGTEVSNAELATVASRWERSLGLDDHGKTADRRLVATQCIDHARQHAARYPLATPSQRLAAASSKLGWLLGDLRKQKVLAVPSRGLQGQFNKQPGSDVAAIDADARESAKRLDAEVAIRREQAAKRKPMDPMAAREVFNNLKKPEFT
jgi:hypothetical protein